MTLRRRRPPPDLSPSSASWLPPRSQGRPLRRLRSSGRMPLPCGSPERSRVQRLRLRNEDLQARRHWRREMRFLRCRSLVRYPDRRRDHLGVLGLR